MEAGPMEIDEIADIANQTFTLYKLGPIFEFHKSSMAAKEKTFALQLCHNLKLHDGRKTRRSTKRNKSKDDFDGDLRKLDIDIIHLQDIKSYDPEVKPLRFTFEILQYGDDKLSQYSFYMLPSPQVPKNEKRPGVLVYYPLLLIKAPQRLRQEIITWFEKRYVAACTPLFMYPATMVDAVHVWIDSILDIEENLKAHIHVPEQMLRPPLVLEYQTGDEDMSNVKLRISRTQALAICNRIPNRKQFMRAFEKHVEKTTHVRLDTLTLNRVTSSIATVRKNGYVKISPHSYKAFAVRLLQVWIDLAVEKLYKNV
ncbi:bifunctional 4-alpha-glucanotransferase/amylo-alpha-1,6-glucosidase [Mucor velutinosus]|uniref:Bifunctional 4-alpha-glucanotransferase/amylo-alpha-1,6-glucosidase n=1 Tax=Mucor velutinosus TaxID=708070 RepID=A0AAN7D7B7_9FUNG|nr:bifunctional 4-alpha-glucanotransferase/amylo-alpha-1,6-glucosidase [Mucor velutinosus]